MERRAASSGRTWESSDYSRFSQPVPFTRRLRNFVQESRKCQTLYANCEGSYARRVLEMKDEHFLKEFVYSTMYSRDGGCWKTSSDERKKHEVEVICLKMLSMNRRYRRQNEIAFSVVWVYFCEYDSDVSCGAVPVFKVYKREDGSDAVYLDVHVTEYETWDDYLENSVFPNSFLCVPRHGEYHFDDDAGKLDLEFVTSQRAEPHPWRMNFQGFCTSIVRPILNLTDAKWWEKVKRICGALWNWIKENKYSIIAVISFSAVMTATYFFPIPTVRALPISMSQITNFSYMLLNVFDPKILKSLESPNPMDAATFSRDEFMNEVNEMGRLLKSDKREWRKILKSFCRLFRYAQPLLLNFLSSLSPTCTSVLTVLCALLLAAENCDKFLNLTKPVSKNGNTQEQIQVVPSKSSAISDSLRLLTAEPTARQAVALPDMSPHLQHLETNSAAKVESMALAATQGTELVPTDRPVIVERTLPDICFFVNDVSVPELNRITSRFLFRNFSLQPRENDDIDVISSGQVVGTWCFPTDRTAVGLFSSQVVDPNRTSEILRIPPPAEEY